MENIKTFDDLLRLKYGEKGAPAREAFEARAMAYYICETLKEERKKNNLTQDELAERLQVKKSFISRIENGKVDIQLSTLLKILEGLGLRMSIVPAM